MPVESQSSEGQAAGAPRASPPPFRVAEIDQSTLLTVIELRCAEACRAVRISDQVVVVKYEPARTYLAVTPEQWEALKFFGPGRTAPQVVFQLIMDRMGVPLREFYEVVIKAFDRGVLQAEGHAPPPAVVAAAWRGRVDGRWMRGVAMATIVGALVAMIARPMELPNNVLHLVTGWVLACATISAGYFVAACVVRRANAEVYQPEFWWKTLLPHFRADLDDAVMGGRQAVVDVGLMRMAPTFFALTAAAFWKTGVVLPLFGAVLILLSPFWWSPGLVTVHALYGTPQGDATRHFRFEPNRAPWYALKTRWKHADVRFFGIHVLYALTWLGIVFLAGTLLLRANAAELWHRYIASGGLHFTALALLVALGLAVAGAIGMLAWIGGMFVRDWWRDRQRQEIVPRPGTVTPEAVRELVGRTLLFRGLPEEERAAIAAAAQVEEFPAGALVVREGEAGEKLYLVYSGRVEVLRELSTGRQDAVAVLQAGEVFGEVSLLRSKPRTRSARTLEKCVLLSLSREAFQRLVLSKMSRDAVEDTVQKIGFLHRIPLARNWSPHAMAAFGRRAAFRDFQEDEFVIREGEDNQFFHVLYEGQLAVRRGGKDIATLKVGDFFGEISLLQNSVAKATIKARTPGRCLIMNKRDFLQFLAKDFVIGLQFESISSKRLGQPIFPLKGGSFEVMRG